MLDTDYKKAQKFERGLDLDVFDRVGILKLPTYVEVFDRALMAEATLAAKKQVKALTTEWRGKRRGFNFRKGRSFSKKQNTRSSSSSSQSNGTIPVCPDCRRKHKGVCYHASGACYRCGKVGYIMKDCPLGAENANHPAESLARSASVTRSNVRTNVRGNTGNVTLRQWRVFALVPGDVQNTESVVSGIISIYPQNAYVLIDSGSSHSFVSRAFSRKLTRPLEPMNYLLFVSMPFWGSMVCAYVYLACDIVIGDMILYVDLLPLGIDHFDYILGMNCVVPPPYLISAMKAIKLLRKGCMGYMCYVLTETSDCSNVETILVACEFSNVFPIELPGDLIDKEIEFTIDVLPGTQPISETHTECQLLN
ncbi:uncharacterized protein LOC114288494 [Camellia sinensis]|uniref:uncharacterized protein LOC114288494 n=1 Tax=Camellia sinensis TaxID=4442 RepID=UPI0010369D0F|nr:uncharacterized protein LOC114288494 [Camellia sinensis]